MLSLTRKADYALLALNELAHESDRTLSVRTLAERTGIGVPVLTNVMKSLARAQIVVSARGARGGYNLGRPPEWITLEQVVAAVEGPMQYVRQGPSEGDSPEEDGASPKADDVCPVHRPVRRVHEHLVGILGSVTLADMLEEQQEFAPVAQRA